jgi:DNA helicase-2/ATP-dependent DNA helicase PcrA
VPISSGEEASILDNDLGRQVLAILRLVRNMNDHLAWRTLLKIRKNGLGVEANNELYELGQKNGLTYFEAIKKVVNEAIPHRFRDKLIQEYQQINLLVDKIGEFIEQVKEIPTIEPFLNPLLEIILPNAEDREVILGALSDSIRTNNINSIDELLNFSEASDMRIEQDIQLGKVNILTMHKAKGLTADIVFVVAAEDEHIPSRYTAEPELGDERRLLFVSLTRAKHRLFITYCNERIGQQKMLGRNVGDPNRSLTQFLRDSWLRPEDGTASINRLVQNTE